MTKKILVYLLVLGFSLLLVVLALRLVDKSNSSNLTFVSEPFSEERAYEVFDFLNRTIPNLQSRQSVADNVIGWGPVIIDGQYRVAIQLSVYTNEQIRLFRNTILDDPILYFKDLGSPSFG